MKAEVFILLLLTLVSLLIGLLSALQRNLLYPAPQTLRETPAARGLEYEEVNLETASGGKTHAWFVPAIDAKAAVIYSHGNGDNVGSSITEAAFLHDLGYAVLLYDYGGYGLSDGRPTEERLYEDIRAAWKHLTQERNIAGSRIVLWGISLGGGASCQLATETEAAALVLEGTFTSIPDVASLRFPLLDFHRIVLDKYENIEKIPGAGEPVLIYHSLNDNTVPFSQGEDLFEAAQKPKKLVQLTGSHAKGTHDEPGVYANAWREFIDPLFDGLEPLVF